MDVFRIEPELTLAIAIAAAFVLGWMANRLVKFVRFQREISYLSGQLARSERQRDSAHQASLELAASHNRLIGEHQEAEWTIRTLKSDLRLRDARIEKLTDERSCDLPAVNEDFWVVEETVR
jgi:hypothetical protein